MKRVENVVGERDIEDAYHGFLNFYHPSKTYACLNYIV